MALVDEVESLNHRAALHALARILAQRIEASPATSGTLAGESSQLRSTLAEIRALPFEGVQPKGGGKVVSADEARLRRDARRAAAEVEPAAVKGGRKRG